MLSQEAISVPKYQHDGVFVARQGPFSLQGCVFCAAVLQTVLGSLIFISAPISFITAMLSVFLLLSMGGSHAGCCAATSEVTGEAPS